MPPHRRLLRGPPLIRPGRDADAPAFITLIERCWADYPDCPLDVDAEAPELRALASYYAQDGGALWIADPGTGVGPGIGMVATRPITPTTWEICRVYVHPDRHGTSLGAQLLATAEAHAQAAGATALELWTDTRFHRAHRFYAKHGYAPTDGLRELHDLGRTVEQHYRKALSPL